jgi:CHAT domain
MSSGGACSSDAVRYMSVAFGQRVWWLNSWMDRNTVVTAATGPDHTIVHRAVVEVDAHLAWLACLGVVYPLDRRVAGGNEETAAMLAGYRTAIGPLLGDADLAGVYAEWLTSQQRHGITGHPAVRLAAEEGESQLLWRLSQQFLAPELRNHLLGQIHAGQRMLLAVDPVPALGRLPWGLLPLAAPSGGEDLDVPRVLDGADVVYTPPATFLASLDPAPIQPKRTGTVLLVADSLGDLTTARSYHVPGGEVLGGWWTGDPARVGDAPRVLAKLADDCPATLIVVGHVRGGADPPDAAMVMAPTRPGESPTELTARDLYQARSAPRACVLLGCDSIGAAVGFEWTGLAQGLLWAGARHVTGTLWPTLDDAVTAEVEQSLILDVADDGLGGTWKHAVRFLRAWREAPDRSANRPYRWATYGLVGGRAG